MLNGFWHWHWHNALTHHSISCIKMCDYMSTMLVTQWKQMNVIQKELNCILCLHHNASVAAHILFVGTQDVHQNPFLVLIYFNFS